MKPVRFHRAARVELDEAMAFYETQSTGLGLDLQAEVEQAIRKIRGAPQSWPSHRHTGCRKFFVRRFPYLIFYSEFDDFLWIAAIVHGKREPGYWIKRRPESPMDLP